MSPQGIIVVQVFLFINKTGHIQDHLIPVSTLTVPKLSYVGQSPTAIAKAIANSSQQRSQIQARLEGLLSNSESNCK